MRLVLISDTHGFHEHLVIPGGDVLIHAGDFTLSGGLSEVDSFDKFLGEQPHQHKLVVAGNHDFCFERQPLVAREHLTNAKYLQDSGCEIGGYHFYGSPWQPFFMDMAFNLESDEARHEKWEMIPSNTDILITHTPPRGILDLTSLGICVGCQELSKIIDTRNLRAHVFGHIHEAYGIELHGSTTYANACNCDLLFQPSQPPLVIDV